MTLLSGKRNGDVCPRSCSGFGVSTEDNPVCFENPKVGDVRAWCPL